MPNLSDFLKNEVSLTTVLQAAHAYDVARHSNWAIVLLRFNDQNSPVPPRDFYERLFTRKGAGTLNMVEFFHDVSHGRVDLSKSEVFGWFTIDHPRSDYTPTVADKDLEKGKFNRHGLTDVARQAALDNNVLLDSFDGFVFSFAGRVDLFGTIGGMQAVCDTASLWPSLLGQEMGHGYGLDHSRADGSDVEYNDPWDTMSTNVGGSNSTPDPDYTFVGPGLNAWNMRSRDWLDEARVWKPQFKYFQQQDVQLRPLHRHDLSGYLAAELGPYLVEYGVTEKWDAGMFGGSGILVHRFEDNRSYLMGSPGVLATSSPQGRHAMKKGESFQVGEVADLFSTVYRCEVLALDDASHTATVRLFYRPGAEIPGPHQRPFDVGVTGSDAGTIYLQHGKVVRIPPRGPSVSLLNHVAAYAEAAGIAHTGIRDQARAVALTNLIREALGALKELDPVRVPAPAERQYSGD